MMMEDDFVDEEIKTVFFAHSDVQSFQKASNCVFRCENLNISLFAQG